MAESKLAEAAPHKTDMLAALAQFAVVWVKKPCKTLAPTSDRASHSASL